MTDEGFDLTARTAPLAEAAARIARLLPARSLQPVLAGVLLRADGDTLVLCASDGEQSAEVRVPAGVHTAGEVVVSRRGLSETLAALDTYDVRLVAEGSRLALRTPGARFALPQLDAATFPRPAEPPPIVGRVAGPALRAAAVPVAGAASREAALPIFTGIRIRPADGRLSLVATDRFRMAAATVPWQPAGTDVGADALVPAALLAEVAKQAGSAETVDLHVDRDRFGVSWVGGSVTAASLATPFPDRQIDQLLDIRPDCTVEVDADEFGAAVRRATPYSGPHGRVGIRVADGVLIVQSSDPVAGESEENVKATCAGDHLTRAYQGRLLIDALRPFAGGRVRMRVQAGLRATAFGAAEATGIEPGKVELSYLVVPLRAAESIG